MNRSTVKPAATATPQQPEIPAMPAIIHQLGSTILYALFFVAPLIFLPPAALLKNSLDTPRRLLIFLGTGLLAALIIYSWSARRRFVLRRHPLDLPVILLFLGAVISSIAGVFPLISFFGPVYCEDGLALLWMSVVIYFSVKEFLRTPRQVETAVFLLVLSGGCSALLGYLDWVHVFPFSFNPSFTAQSFKPFVDWHNLFNQRLVATMGNSMFTGTFFAILIPLAYGAVLAAKDMRMAKWIAYAIFSLSVALGLFFEIYLDVFCAGSTGIKIIAGVLFVICVPLFGLLLNKPSTSYRNLLLCSLVLMLPALLLTMARAAWIGLALTLVITAILMSHMQKRWLLLSSILMLPLLCFSLMMSPLLLNIRNYISHTHDTFGLCSNLALILLGLGIWAYAVVIVMLQKRILPRIAVFMLPCLQIIVPVFAHAMLSSLAIPYVLLISLALLIGLPSLIMGIEIVMAIAKLPSMKQLIPIVKIIIPLFLLLIALVIGLSIRSVRTRLQSVVSMEGETIQTRKIYMTTGVNEFLHNPIQGVGFGNFQLVFQQYRPSSTSIELGLPLNRGYNAALPHNLFLQIAGECGILGLLPFLFLLFMLYHTSVPALRAPGKHAWLSAGLLGLCTCSLITNLSAFDNFATTMLFWAALGLLASLHTEEKVVDAGDEKALLLASFWMSVLVLLLQLHRLLMELLHLITHTATVHTAENSGFYSSLFDAHFFFVVVILAGIAILSGIRLNTLAHTGTGKRGNPLSTHAISLLHVACLVIAFYSVLAFCTQFLTALLLQQGAISVASVERHNAMVKGDPIDVETCKAGVRDIQAANALAFLNPDYNGYQTLFIAYHSLFNVYIDQVQLTSPNNPQESPAYDDLKQVYHDMLEAGNHALRLMDRDPMTLRLMVMELTQSPLKTDLQVAQRLADLLVRNEPHSAEAHVIAADVYERVGGEPENTDQRMDFLHKAIADAAYATRLDPSFKEAWARLGHLNVSYGISYGNTLDNGGMQVLEDACSDYEHAKTLGVNLNPQDSLDYTAALIRLGRIPQALDTSRKMRNFPELFNRLCNYITATYNSAGRKAEGEQLIKQLNALP